MGVERKAMTSKMRDEHKEFVLWLAKQADSGYGITPSSAMDRMVGFVRALYIVSQDALDFSGLQGLPHLLRTHGLPVRRAEEPGLSPTEDLPHKQARLQFFSRPNRRAVSGMEARDITTFRVLFDANTRRVA